MIAQLDQARAAMGVSRGVDLLISHRITSPFLCGWRRPAILIPASLAPNLSQEERSALFAHELAHLRRHDLFWCTTWRVTLTILWFHPLVWNITNAHELACEQEADRLASGNISNRLAYARLLAGFALQVLAIPASETRSALSATSQISRRLAYLKSAPSSWSRGKSFAAGSLLAALFLAIAGCELTARKPIDVNAPVEFKKVLVSVHDEAGKPIEGAVVTPNGIRVKGIHAADGYGWNAKRFGPPVPATTNADGNTWVQYPVMGIAEEQELTGPALGFNVSRDGYSTTSIQTYYVDKPNDVVVMKQSATLDVSAWFGPSHTPVTDFVANLSGGRPGDWEKRPDGHFVNAKAAPGEHVLQLAARLPSGQMVFSEGILVNAEREKATTRANEMTPGIRVEGRIDASIPRPIANAHVFLSVRPPQFPVNRIVEDYYAPGDKFGYMTFWHTYRPINPDGTFVFEAVPPGEADLVSVGDGFTSKSQGEFVNRMPDGSIETWEKPVVVPQAFPLAAPMTTINLLAEPSATLQVTAKDKGGKPIEGAQIFVSPNVVRIPAGGILGTMVSSSESPFLKIDPLPRNVYGATTDKDGQATIPNLPAVKTALEIEDSNYQAQVQQPNGWRDRHVRATFSSGQTLKMDLTLESKGSDFLGLLR